MKPNACLAMQQTVVQPGTEATRQLDQWSFIRVCAGMGYARADRQNIALKQGDLVVAPAGVQVGFRASQLSAMTLCHFDVCLADLPGLFTLAEEQSLAKAAQEGRVAVRVFPEDTEQADQFLSLCTLQACGPGLALRGEMLRLATHALCEASKNEPESRPANSSPDRRFRELLQCLSASQLMSRSATELAAACCCSVRHFRRLFREQFGLSLVAWQIQQRIRKAMRLLRQSDTKVADVALESGFRHLGQFNDTFKRVVGMTPSAWRQARPLHLRPVLCPPARHHTLERDPVTPPYKSPAPCAPC